MLKLTGKLKVKNDTVQVSEKFSKREFVLTDDSSMYPQDILFQLTQDKCNLLDAFGVNEQIEVSFNLRGREWISPQGEVRYFNTLDAWKIETLNVAPKQDAPKQAPAPSNNDDDLPFE